MTGVSITDIEKGTKSLAKSLREEGFKVKLLVCREGRKGIGNWGSRVVSLIENDYGLNIKAVFLANGYWAGNRSFVYGNDDKWSVMKGKFLSDLEDEVRGIKINGLG